MTPVTVAPNFTQLVNMRTQLKAREDLGSNLIGENGIDVLYPDDKNTTISLHINLSGSLSVTPNTAEMGQVITSVNLTWSYNKPVLSQSINNGVGAITPVSLRAYTHSPTLINTNTSYILTANDGYTTINPSASVTYYHRRYWGVSVNASLTEAEIKLGSTELSNSRPKSTNYNCTGGRRFWYAYPTYLGLASATVNGFTFSGWIGGTTPQTISITNAYGYTENYYYYLSNNIQNGASIPVAFS